MHVALLKKNPRQTHSVLSVRAYLEMIKNPFNLHLRIFYKIFISTHKKSKYAQNITNMYCQIPELKTEEGYSADIVRTYIPGDICPHNIRTMSAQHLTKDICLTRRCCADIYLQGYMSAQYPHYILLRFSAQRISQNWAGLGTR